MMGLGTWLTRKRKPVFLWYDRHKDGSEYHGLFYDDMQSSTWDENGKNDFYSDWDLVEFVCPLPEEFVNGKISLFEAMFPAE